MVSRKMYDGQPMGIPSGLAFNSIAAPARAAALPKTNCLLVTLCISIHLSDGFGVPAFSVCAGQVLVGFGIVGNLPGLAVIHQLAARPQCNGVEINGLGDGARIEEA